MILKKHSKNIVDHDSWRRECPPKKGDMQWVDGRSAKELAKYITKNLYSVPAEIESVLKPIVSSKSELNWDAESVSSL